MNLETNRLIIRNLRESDLEDFFEYRSDPRVCEFQGYEPITREDAEKFFGELKDAQPGKPGECVRLGIELKSKNKLIGDIALKSESNEPRIVEGGVSLSNQYQGNGYAKEALTAVFDFLFNEAAIHRITGIVDVENPGVIRLLETLKFRREAEFKQSFWDASKNEWRDEFLYAMLASD